MKMLKYDRIDISEGIDVNKTNLSKECDICHHWYFKDIGFKQEKYLYNGCHDLIKKAMSFDNVAIVYVKESAYRINFWYMSKYDAMNMVLIWLIKVVLYKIFYYNFFFVIYKNE